jgi:hypothetical protein
MCMVHDTSRIDMLHKQCSRDVEGPNVQNIALIDSRPSSDRSFLDDYRAIANVTTQLN